MSPRLLIGTALLAACMQSVALAQTADPAAQKVFVPTVGQAGKDVIWVPTDQALVDRMLDMAKLTPQDYLVDLGSGDGRTVITAAKRGSRAHGIEFNPDMVALSRMMAEKEGVTDKATFEQADIFESDFSDADVVTMFLLPSLNLKLRPTLLDMEPGTRVVSNSFTMEDWSPDETYDAGQGCSSFCRAYLWIVPAKVEGNWQLGNGTLELKQTFQMLEGTLREGGKETPITDARLNGKQISFSAGGNRYTGTVEDKRMNGRMNDATAWSASRQ